MVDFITNLLMFFACGGIFMVVGFIQILTRR